LIYSIVTNFLRGCTNLCLKKIVLNFRKPFGNRFNYAPAVPKAFQHSFKQFAYIGSYLKKEYLNRCGTAVVSLHFQILLHILRREFKIVNAAVLSTRDAIWPLTEWALWQQLCSTHHTIFWLCLP
jgi:hypothetical protein